MGDGYGKKGSEGMPGREWELFEGSEVRPGWVARDVHRCEESPLVRAKQHSFEQIHSLFCLCEDGHQTVTPFLC